MISTGEWIKWECHWFRNANKEKKNTWLHLKTNKQTNKPEMHHSVYCEQFCTKEGLFCLKFRMTAWRGIFPTAILPAYAFFFFSFLEKFLLYRNLYAIEEQGLTWERERFLKNTKKTLLYISYSTEIFWIWSRDFRMYSKYLLQEYKTFWGLRLQGNLIGHFMCCVWRVTV